MTVNQTEIPRADEPVKWSADEWNRRYEQGQRVKYFPVKGRPGFVQTATRSKAWTLGHAQAVVKVVGISGGVALEHLEVVR